MISAKDLVIIENLYLCVKKRKFVYTSLRAHLNRVSVSSNRGSMSAITKMYIFLTLNKKNISYLTFKQALNSE